MTVVGFHPDSISAALPPILGPGENPYMHLKRDPDKLHFIQLHHTTL